MSLDRYVTHAVLRDWAAERVNVRRDDLTAYRAQVANLRSKLERHIAEHPDYGLVKIRQSGSVAKGTALKTINDMDVAVYVRAADAPSDEGQLLVWLADRLRDAYPQKAHDDFTIQHHCVTILFHGTGLNVDVVPVIYEGEADDIGYLITKDTGARVRTSVTQHLKFIRARKDAQPLHFAQTVRLMKWWVRQLKQQDEDFRFKSFMIELLCAHVADEGQSFADYPAAVEAVLAYIVRSGLEAPITFADFDEPEQTPTAPLVIIDPVNSDNNVAASYSHAQRDAIVSAAHDALDAVQEAQYATTKGRAVERWQTLFGPLFRP
jgi:tRNA nucleotidyltransferase (CCA-adding enzyme)